VTGDANCTALGVGGEIWWKTITLGAGGIIPAPASKLAATTISVRPSPFRSPTATSKGIRPGVDRTSAGRKKPGLATSAATKLAGSTPTPNRVGGKAKVPFGFWKRVET